MGHDRHLPRQDCSTPAARLLADLPEAPACELWARDRTILGSRRAVLAHDVRSLGEPVLGSFDDDTALLGCGCGVCSCGPFSAVVEVDDDVVVWSRFRFADPGVLFTDLRDLVFDRAQYEAAVRTTEIGGGGRVYRSRGHRSVR